MIDFRIFLGFPGPQMQINPPRPIRRRHNPSLSLGIIMHLVVTSSHSVAARNAQKAAEGLIQTINEDYSRMFCLASGQRIGKELLLN